MLLSNNALEVISSLPRSCYQAPSATSHHASSPGWTDTGCNNISAVCYFGHINVIWKITSLTLLI